MNSACRSALERQDAGDDRHPVRGDPLEEALELGDVENRSSDDELRSRLDLVLEPPQLLLEVDAAGFTATPM